MSLLSLFQSADHSWIQQLKPDPDTEKHQPNKQSRQVKSGHYVLVSPTPLPKPKLVIYSASMAEALGLSEEECNSQEFLNFFSGQQQLAGGKLQSWCTPYALSIMGQAMVRNCPFGNGNGYGDGRAISIGEVVVKGQRWEMQLKGGGQTPFCRGADGRAVLRSSVREFLASEAMYHLGIDTTRALSLVVSAGEMAERPWYSEGNRESDPDMMVRERCAITTRVAPSFLRVGHVDLFSRRAQACGATPEQVAEHELMLQHALFREYPECEGSLPQRCEEMLRRAGKRFAQLISGWLRVGFCQGNFNADNCLVGGRTMDYGPFGWIERYDPSFAKWVGSSMHFAFMNQPQAALANFMTFAKAMQPVLPADRLEELVRGAQEEMTRVVAQMWRQKLGFEEADAKADALWKQLESLMRFTVDFTMLFRLLADALELSEEDEETELKPGCLVRLDGLKSSELNGEMATCLSLASEGRWAVSMLSEDGAAKSVKAENLRALQSGERLFASIACAFYDQPSLESRGKWLDWLRRWRHHVPGAAAAAQAMRQRNPKYVPREWMLVQAYDAASEGDFGPVKRLHQLFLRPYDEQPEFAEFFRLTPPCYRGKGGVEIMT